MKNKILLLSIITVLVISVAFIIFYKNKEDRTDYLDKVKTVTIYTIDTETAMNYDIKAMSELDFSTIDNLKGNFSKITYKDEATIWKGDRFGIIHMKDGSELKIRISNYGNFFSVVGKDGYYIYEKKQK